MMPVLPAETKVTVFQSVGEGTSTSVRAQQLLTQTDNQTRRRMMDVRASHVLAGPSPSLRIECSIEGIEVASRLLEVTQIFRGQQAIHRIVHNNAYPLCQS